jgi:hypothetical protein
VGRGRIISWAGAESPGGRGYWGLPGVEQLQGGSSRKPAISAASLPRVSKKQFVDLLTYTFISKYPESGRRGPFSAIGGAATTLSVRERGRTGRKGAGPLILGAGEAQDPRGAGVSRRARSSHRGPLGRHAPPNEFPSGSLPWRSSYILATRS